ncbi:bifunctional phosphopantothenoylcysteine decarboxylase/phosphopantothenate--cysteine ligase CoaBC [Edaphobacter sp. HDX4]|uniref:bifunctional phosphopantothenoylcysteine decarboxylase/phosphopantothenate--cysteine ligase CoaBC n=1 Tax=Edaphobacter sp. HDX4 TaxID=2794064 RepID=UPI002FE690E6
MAERIKVTVGVAGGIAAYKAVEVVRQLQDAGLNPHVVMTAAAEKFIQPLTFAAITGHKVISSLWNEDAGASGGEVSGIEHINEAQTTAALVIVPATADILARFAHGIADDFLTTMYLATTAPVIVAPAMNVVMWQHPATQANLETLRKRGVTIVEPDSGYLACGMVGGGRLAEESAIVATVAEVLAHPSAGKKLALAAGKKLGLVGETILITAGGTREAIDPVRFIGNRSSGKMGYALAAAARSRGARVILISAPTALPAPEGCELVPVTSSEEMRTAVLAKLAESKIVIMAAAVSDYRVAQAAPQKLKREGPRILQLEPTADILKEVVKQRNPDTLVIGFAAETEDVLANGRAKLVRKGADALVINDVSGNETGFDSDRNAGWFVTPETQVELSESTKVEMAERILDQAVLLRKAQSHAVAVRS